MTAEHENFCRRLREARQSRDLTLEAITDVSKINVALLAGLERGDLSRWPKGIFRRAFLREYASAIGLSPEHTVREIVRLFPEEGEPATRRDVSAPQGGLDAVRLTLASSPHLWIRPTARGILTACLDLAVVLLTAGAISLIFRGQFQLMVSVIALVYYGSATACIGSTPASVWLNRGAHILSRSLTSQRKPTPMDGPRLVFRRPAEVAESTRVTGHESPSHESLRAASNQG
jgi:transcriptional regulator with XRE-family HTH domain